MTRQLKATLRGPDAALGRVAAADFANLLLATERAVARAAGHLIRRPVKETGRWAGVIEQASRLRLVAVREGNSVSAFLETPDLDIPPDSMDLDVADLSEMALSSAMDAIEGIGPLTMPDVVQVWAVAATQLGVGVRFDEIILETLPDESHPGRAAVIDNQRRIEFERRPLPKSAGPNRIFGLLVEADFESNRAHLRTPTGERISIQFDGDLADDIQEALRHPAELGGEVTYDRATGRAKSVRLRELTMAEQLMIDLDIDFWNPPTINELVAEQSVEPVTDWDEYRGPPLSPDELDSMLEFLDS